MVMLFLPRMSRKTAYILAVISMLLLLVSTVTVYAVARGYKTDDSDLKVGMVVSLLTEDTTKVERTTPANQSLMVGVVVNADGSSLTVAQPDADVLVESEGEVQVYVSDLNGPVKKGDVLAVSPIKGVLVRANPDYSFLAGIATSDASADASSYTLDDNGKTIQTKVSLVSANLNRKGSQGNTTEKPSTLSSLGEALTGKYVSPVRVIVGLILFAIVIIIEGAIIYGAVSSSITAFGRNPLARALIQNELKFVAGLAVTVLTIGLAAVYVILWL